MKLIELVQHEFEKFSTDLDLMERLMIQGKAGMYAWAIRRLCHPESKRFRGDITGRLSATTALIENEISFSKVRYYYYSYPTTSLSLIATQENFESVYAILMGRLNDSMFWESVMPTCWWECVRVAIELMVEKNARVSYICRQLNVSQALVYRIRKRYLQRVIDKKGSEL